MNRIDFYRTLISSSIDALAGTYTDLINTIDEDVTDDDSAEYVDDRISRRLDINPVILDYILHGEFDDLDAFISDAKNNDLYY